MATVRSQSRRRKKQRLPNLVGLDIEDARLVLQHRGFFDPNLLGTPDEGRPFVDVRYVKNFAPYGTVVAQKPTRGQIVDSDARVELVVSMESLLDYLPGIFRRRDVDGSNFMQEFLWIFMHVFRSLEAKIERMHDYFEVFETPEDFLPWLAGWVAFTLDGEWTENERRLYLKRAVKLYRIRGTVKGLETFLEMYAGTKPNIIENDWPLDGFQIGVSSTIGIDSAVLPPIKRAHCFIVEVPLDPETVDDDQIIKLHQIITLEKPAHTTYYLRFTGEQKTLSRWTGPVIGEYMVAAPETFTEEELAAMEAEAKGEKPAEASEKEDEKKKKTTRSRRSSRKKK